MSLNIPIIGWAKPVPVDTRNFHDPRRGFALVALAGPVSNLVLAAGGALLWRLLPSSGDVQAPTMISLFVYLVVLVNVLLAVFNMIPVPPLDGGNVLMGLVPARVAVAIGWLRPYGFMILYLLMFSGLLMRVTAPIRGALVEWLL